MDKYEYRVKTEQLLEYTEKKQYRKAMEIADTIDWRRVKNASMLNTVSEVYENCGEFQKSRDILFMAFDRSPGSRKIVYRLATLALKVNDPDEASDCYEEFVKLAPKDPNQYILKYRILKAQRAPLEEQIATLEEFKKAEYIEKWAYELAKMYHEAGMVRECLEECDDLILWFSEGKYVYLAMELKMKYKPLTPLQQEKYDRHTGKKTKDIVIPGQDDDEDDTNDESGVEQSKEETRESEALKEKTEPEEKEEDKEQTAPSIEKSAEDPSEEKVEEKTEEESEEVKKKPRAPITRIVTGATLEEALASGVAMAAGLNQEEKAMADRDEELKANGQMKIEDILQEWEEKQKMNADAIKKQKAEDKERLKKERQEAEKRKEAARKAAEEAARKAEEAARKKAAEEEARKAEEEAKKRAAEEEARKAEEAARMAEEAKKRKKRLQGSLRKQGKQSKKPRKRNCLKFLREMLLRRKKPRKIYWKRKLRDFRMIFWNLWNSLKAEFPEPLYPRKRKRQKMMILIQMN